MIIYEVNLTINPEVEAEFRSWLTDHIKQMLKLPGFIAAQIFTRKADEEDRALPKKALLTVHYTVKSRKELEEYFEKYAVKMRADGLQKFPEAFTVHRRILYPTLDNNPF